jgi:glycosyl transferase-like sugar-binding protein
MAGAEVIQSLWIGSRLSSMEQLCICSFLRQGHPFHLYAFGPLENVPEGTELKSAEEILPASEVFTYRRGRGKGNPSAFSNLFRYKLLLERGGWWSDLDVVCLQRLEFTAEHVLGCQRRPDREPAVNVGLVRAPAGSPLMRRCYERAAALDKSQAKWGDLGPGVARRALRDVDVSAELLPPEVFYPVDYWNIESLVRPYEIPDACQAIHLWNSEWRHASLDPDERFATDSLYERLRAAYLPSGWEETLQPSNFSSRLRQAGFRWLRAPLHQLRGVFGRGQKRKEAA